MLRHPCRRDHTEGVGRVAGPRPPRARDTPQPSTPPTPWVRCLSHCPQGPGVQAQPPARSSPSQEPSAGGAARAPQGWVATYPLRALSGGRGAPRPGDFPYIYTLSYLNFCGYGLLL